MDHSSHGVFTDMQFYIVQKIATEGFVYWSNVGYPKMGGCHAYLHDVKGL